MDEETRLKLSHTLGTEGWQNVMAPAFRDSIEMIKQQLVLRPSQRMPDFKDASAEWLGGMHQALSWGLTNWEQQMKVSELNEQRAAQNGKELEPEAVGSPYGAPEGADA